MKKIIIGLIVAAAAGYGLLSYHFIILDSGVKVLKKTNMRYENSVIDARGSKKLELPLKPDLIAAGINELLAQLEESVQQKEGR